MKNILVIALLCVAINSFAQNNRHFQFSSYSSSRSYDSIGVLSKGKEDQGSIRIYGNDEYFETNYDRVYRSTRKKFLAQVDISNYKSAEEYMFQEALFIAGAGDTPNVEINRCYLKNLIINGGRFSLFSISRSELQKLTLTNISFYDYFILSDASSEFLKIENCLFSKPVLMSITSDKLSYFSLEGNRFDSYFDFELLNLPDTLNLQNLDLLNFNGIIDLTKSKRTKSRKCLINLYRTDIDKIRLRYTDFQLYFPKDISFEDSVYVYQSLLNRLEKDGLPDSYKKLDIELKELKYRHNKKKITMWIDKTWWNYGYNKEFVILNTLLICLCFFFINFLFFKPLLFKVYTIEPIKAQYDNIARKYYSNTIVQKILNSLYCLVYTCYIFWGIKLDYLKLNIKTPAFVWIIFQYISGIVCLAYIANYIITR